MKRDQAIDVEEDGTTSEPVEKALYALANVVGAAR